MYLCVCVCSSENTDGGRGQTHKEVMNTVAEMKKRLPSDKRSRSKASTVEALHYALNCVKQVQGNLSGENKWSNMNVLSLFFFLHIILFLMQPVCVPLQPIVSITICWCGMARMRGKTPVFAPWRSWRESPPNTRSKTRYTFLPAHPNTATSVIVNTLRILQELFIHSILLII